MKAESLPASYLQLTLADIIALGTGAPARRDEPCSLDLIVVSLERFAAQLAADEAARATERREWLAQQFDSVTTELP